MEKLHKSNLARLALAMLDSPITLNMMMYVHNPNCEKLENGRYHPIVYQMTDTQCCFLGFAPMVFHKGQIPEDWPSYARSLFGKMYYEVFSFLFRSRIGDNKNKAVSRVLEVLENGDRKWIDFLCLTAEERKTELQKYIA